MSLEVPNIVINEIIENQPIVFNSNIKTACLIPSETGEGNIPFIINNTQNLVDNVPLTENNYKYWWQAWNYLQYNNEGIYIVRPIKLTDRNYYISITDNNIVRNNSVDNLYNSEVAQSLLFTDYTENQKVRIYNKYVNSKNDIAVLLCDSSDKWNLAISNENIDVIRDINRFDYDVVNTSLNNTYHVVTKKILSNVKKYETGNNKSYLTFNENLTFVKNNQVLRGIVGAVTFNENLTFVKNNQVLRGVVGAVNESFTVNNISYNIYKTPSITAVNTVEKKITLNGYHGYLEINDKITVGGFSDEYTITNIQIVEDGSFNITTILTLDKITVTSATQTYIAIGNTAIIQSDTTLIYTENNLTTTTNYETVEWLDNSWNSFISSNISDNSILKYNESSLIWEIISLSDKNYFVYNKQKVYNLSTGVFTLTNIEANYIDKTVAVNNLYSSEVYYSNGTIKSFNDIFLTSPNFDNDEFGMIVLKKNTNNLFEVKEKYIIDYSNKSENLVFSNSKYIYYKCNKTLNNKANTYNKSIVDCTIIDNSSLSYDNIDRYSYNDLKECLYSLKDANAFNIEYLLGFRYISDNNIYNFDLASQFAEERQDILCLQGLYEESDYIGKLKNTMLQNLYNTFGIDGINPKQFYKNGSYTSIFGNMKLQYDMYNDKNIWVPIIGDVAGLFIENENNDISTVGFDLPIKNCIRLLFNFTDETDRKSLNNNGINSIVYNNLKQPVIFESITCTKDKYSVVREMHKRRWSNKIKQWFKDNTFGTLLKIASTNNISRLRDQLTNYCNTLVTFGVIKNNFTVNAYNVGSVIVIDLSISFNDIVRKLVFNIRLSGGQITISESEK